MRILAAIPDYPPDSRVGAFLASHELLVYLVGCGHEVTAMVMHGHEFVPYALDGVAVVPLIRGLDLDAGVRSADLVISHCGDNGAAARTSAKYAKPNVRLAHGAIADPACLAGAALVVFNSWALAGSVDCPAASIVCHPPVYADRWRTTPGEHVTLVNLSEAKGGELFWRLVRNAPHRRFLAVRGGWGAQYIDRSYANTTLLEFCTAEMRDDVYAKTRILLMPSEREAWGMTAVEAMASGIPVIASPAAGLVEALAGAGVFVPRSNHQRWLDEIERLHDPGEWAAASARSLARSGELELSRPAELDRFVNHVEAVGSLQCA